MCSTLELLGFFSHSNVFDTKCAHTYTHILCPLPLEKDEDEGKLGPDGASIHSRPRSNYCGVEVVSKLKIGTRIRRGPDWNWGVQVRAGSSLIHSTCIMNTNQHLYTLTSHAHIRYVYCTCTLALAQMPPIRYKMLVYLLKA